MSKFEDIDSGRLIYSCNCGWVDLGHANPAKTKRPHIGAVALWEEIRKEQGIQSEYDDGFLLTYNQDMRKVGISATTTGDYFIKYRLEEATKKSIALTIFQEVSMKFETMQGDFPYGLFTDSGFSQEDLVSNLIGFYRALNPDLNVLSLCSPVSKEASKEVWKQSGSVGSNKNVSFLPAFKPCKECTGKPTFPAVLQSITPATKELPKTPPDKGVQFRDWNINFDQRTFARAQRYSSGAGM